MKVPCLDQAALKEALHYDPSTGVFTWRWRAYIRPCTNARLAGTVAGSVQKQVNGQMYRSIRINGRPFLAHRLAVLYMTGEWPEASVDHEDTDGLNNRWGNLRRANQSQNVANSRLSKANTSGLKGAHFHKSRGRFSAQISLGGCRHHLGYHDTAEAAHAAYMQAATAMHGEFARAS